MINSCSPVHLHGGVVPGRCYFASGWFGFPVKFWSHIVGYGAVEEDQDLRF